MPRGADHGERVEREPITGVWGQSPQRGSGAEPLVGGQGAKPPEAESVSSIFIKKDQKFSIEITENPYVWSMGGAAPRSAHTWIRQC